MQVFSLETKDIKGLMVVLGMGGCFLYQTNAGLGSSCNTHVPKNVTAWMQTEATAIGRLL